jgi:hypothetical protein
MTPYYSSLSTIKKKVIVLHLHSKTKQNKIKMINCYRGSNLHICKWDPKYLNPLPIILSHLKEFRDGYNSLKWVLEYRR